MILLDTGDHPGFLYKILQGDYWLFSHINQRWTSPVLDNLLLFVREAEFWIPFYLFLLIFMAINFGKKGWLWSLYLTMTVIISDTISSHLIKDRLVYRLRPCSNPYWADSIHFLANYCPSSSSFTSSHAFNHFAMAVFIYRTLRPVSRWWALALLWAFVISYAQVYVGVHYPLDVVCGGILGSMIGWLISLVFLFHAGKLHLQPNTPTHA
jgi:membrane-associated phospholipid phosphatase